MYQAIDALNRVITDSVGVVGTTPGMTQTTRTAYDLDGNVTEVQHPDLNVTLNNYDLADEPVETDLARLGSGPFTVEDAYSYDAAGNQVADADANANSVDHMQVYDAADRVLQSVDQTYGQTGTQTITTTRGVDPDGNVVTQTVQEMAPSPQTHTDTYAYNADDWLTNKTQDCCQLLSLLRGSIGRDGLSAQVDLADGHVDVAASSLSLPARGPDLALNHTWDSQRAQNGDMTAAARLRHFLQPDPSTQGGLPDYSYVNNDPLDVSDPHGLDGAVRAAKLHQRPGAARALQRRRAQLPAR